MPQLGTMLLMFNVLSTIDIPNAGGGPLGVYPIAMSVMIAHLFLLPIDGCSINPTRSFGPSLVAGWANIPGTYDHQQHVFWFGPLFGASLAAIIYGASHQHHHYHHSSFSSSSSSTSSLSSSHYHRHHHQNHITIIIIIIIITIVNHYHYIF
jgi:hypothetical protein